MICKNILKIKLKEGKVVYGTWMIIPSPTLVEIFGKAGMDFVIFDLEHGPITYQTSEDMVRAADVVNCTPLLRVPHNLNHEILRALEIGCGGVVVPSIEDAEEARNAVKAMKYNPMGIRGVSPWTRSAGYHSVGQKDRTQVTNDETLSILLVESVEAINNIETIIEVPNIDVLYIGTYDLSQSLGITDDLYNPQILNILEKSLKMIRDAGIAGGVLAQSEKDAKNWIDMGAQFIPLMADVGLIYTFVKEKFDCLKALPRR
ncbi:MAG: hypothetical protein KAT68_16115 [Bacteroidales bacterium]|nr:hypothetical protein [Bacteroidales bacterium]